MVSKDAIHDDPIDFGNLVIAHVSLESHKVMLPLIVMDVFW